jgi:hypothetical protein
MNVRCLGSQSDIPVNLSLEEHYHLNEDLGWKWLSHITTECESESSSEYHRNQNRIRMRRRIESE